MSKAVFIGRFQPLHKGHYEAIKEFREEYDLAVAVGSADKSGTRENPLSFEQRKEIIHGCFPDIEIVKLEDETKDEEGNKEWIKKLVKKTDPDAIISQNDLVKRLVEEYTDLELVEHELHDKNIYSGTETRRRIRSNEEWGYLVPECAIENIKKHSEDIEESGIQYEFKPGWKKENAYYDTYEK